MKHKNLFLKIYIPFVIVTIIALIVLQILGSKNRIGYLTDFNLNIYKTLELNNLKDIGKDFTVDGKLDEESIKNYLLTNENITNYVYQFRIRYYDKVFRNSDIYGVYPDLSNLPNYMENAEMEEGGSPYGNFITSRKIIEIKNIDVSYTLKIKPALIHSLFYIYVLIVLLAIAIYLFRYSIIQNNLRFSFCILMSISVLIFFILLIVQKGGYQLNVVLNGWDLFADFYNQLRYVAERDVYFNTINGAANHAYLPLAFMQFYPFSLFRDYANMDLFAIQTDPISNVSFVIFMSFGILLFFLYLKDLDKKDKYSNIIMILIFFSSTNLINIERGNNMVYAAAFVSIFLALYKSENRTEQIIALISLGLASALKIYPAILGLLLLQEKRYKDIFIASIITLILVFLPFLFFKNGFHNIPRIFYNMKELTHSYGIRYGFYNIIRILQNSYKYAKLFTMIGYLLMLVSIIYSFTINEYWKKVCLLSMLIIHQPTTGFYAELFLYPSIILFLSKDNFVKQDLIFLVLFSFHLMPLQIPFITSPNLVPIISIIIWLIILFEAVINNSGILISYYKNLKNKFLKN